MRPSKAIEIRDATAVVVDWNLPDYTVRCVEALIEDGMPAARIVVVENGATDENWSRISSALSACVLVRTDVNVGFAAANNIGASFLPGQAYLLVNNDAFVHRPGSVASLLARVRQPGVGVVVPRLLNEDLSLQPTVAPFTTPAVALVRASGLSRFVPNRWQPSWGTHWDHGSSREIQSAIGAVMAVGADAWDAVGGLSETSFMYAEDLDLCWHAHDLGFRSWFDGDAEFVHLGAASSSTRWSGRERGQQVAQAEAEMIRRHLAPARAAAALGFMRAGLVARVLCQTALRRRPAAETCRGFLRGYAVRRSSAAARPAPEIEVVRPGTAR